MTKLGSHVWSCPVQNGGHKNKYLGFTMSCHWTLRGVFTDKDMATKCLVEWSVRWLECFLLASTIKGLSNKAVALSMALNCYCSDLGIHYIWPLSSRQLENRFWLVNRRALFWPYCLRTDFSEYLGILRGGMEPTWGEQTHQFKKKWNSENLQNLEKLKISLLGGGDFWSLETISNQLSFCRPSWVAAITRIQKSGCHHSQGQHKDFQ